MPCPLVGGLRRLRLRLQIVSFDPRDPHVHDCAGGGVLDAVHGNLALTVHHQDGLKIVDISDPAAPFVAGGWSLKDLRQEKKDAAVSASMMFFLSLVIMAVSAGTLHVMGMKLNDTVEMISLFEPLGGKIAAFILILGIVGAGISSIFPIILIAPWLISDYTGRERNMRSPMYRLLGFVGILFAFGMQFIDTTPPLLMVFSQAFQALILPAVAIPILFLLNRKSLMKGHMAGRSMNIGLVIIILYSLLTSYFAIADFF